MSSSPRHLILLGACAIGLAVLSACTSGPGSAAPASTSAPAGQRSEDVTPGLPSGRVVAAGTVIDAAGDAQLCLGAIAESYPPQCSGIPLEGWTWEGVDGSESSGDVTWGAYAVFGTYDGERFTNTDPPIMLALYDPIRPADPTEGVKGTASDAELTRVQEDVFESLGEDALSAWPERGRLWVQVVWDDGTIQDAMDAEHGEGVVIVTSALREVE